MTDNEIELIFVAIRQGNLSLRRAEERFRDNGVAGYRWLGRLETLRAQLHYSKDQRIEFEQYQKELENSRPISESTEEILAAHKRGEIDYYDACMKIAENHEREDELEKQKLEEIETRVIESKRRKYKL